MKRPLSLLLLLLCLLVVWKFVSWRLIPQKPLRAVVLDKTVSADDHREHEGLFWVLNNLRYLNKNTGRPFDHAKDYYGFFPLEDKKYQIKALPAELIDKPALIYIADTYGVYTADSNKENAKGERSRLVYGGLKKGEAEAIEKAMTGQNTLVAEFNCLASPSSGEARRRLENLLAVRWSGWVARYFDDLALRNTEIPVWMPHNYEKQYRSTWTFEGPGFVFVRDDDRILVLRDGIETGPKLNRLSFKPEALREYKVTDNLQYLYWFDIVNVIPKRGARILANYKLDVTPEGRKLLADNGLRTVFPAIIKTESPNHTYYLAGDYADFNQAPSFYKSVAWRRHLIPEGANPPVEFFWKVYSPLMGKILADTWQRQQPRPVPAK
jgi:hypothetical protein